MIQIQLKWHKFLPMKLTETNEANTLKNAKKSVFFF